MAPKEKRGLAGKGRQKGVGKECCYRHHRQNCLVAALPPLVSLSFFVSFYRSSMRKKQRKKGEESKKKERKKEKKEKTNRQTEDRKKSKE